MYLRTGDDGSGCRCDCYDDAGSRCGVPVAGCCSDGTGGRSVSTSVSV